MSDEISSDTARAMNNRGEEEENPEGKYPQECSSTDDSAADELFHSFMEIANDPHLQGEQTDTKTGVTDEEMVSSDPSALQLKDDKSDGKKQDSMNGTNDQGSNPSTPQHNDSNSNREELQTDSQSETKDQGEATDSDQKESMNRTLDQDETRDSTDPVLSPVTDVDNSINKLSCFHTDVEDVEEDDSASSVSISSQLNSQTDGVPVEGVTEIPTGTENCNKIMPNPDCDEEKPGELTATHENVQSNSDTTNELRKTKECLENSSDAGNLTQTADDNKNESVNSADVSSGNKEDEPATVTDPETPKAKVTKRLSKAMEALAGLEQQLCLAVTEMKQSNEKDIVETGSEEGLNVETKEDQVAESKNEEQVVSEATVTSEVETGEKGVLVVNKNASQDAEEVVLRTERGSDLTVCETEEKANVCEPDTAANVIPDDSNNKETLSKNDEKESKDVENSKDAVDDKGTDVSIAEVQDNKMESTVSAEQDIPSNKNLQVDDIDVLATGKPADGQEGSGQEADVTAPTNTEELSSKATGEVSKNDNDNVSTERSDSADELNMEVAKAGMPIPDIEITSDESGISELKSLDSLDTEESSNSRPASPVSTDNDIDSDTPSDYGDDDDNNAFDPDNLGASNRKSWLLETDRDRLSSDSSTVSERDFRESFSKSDSADGKSPKEDYIRGHLLKMGGSGLTPKNWRKRWFVLRGDNCLYYYKHSKDKGPCGVIILSNYSISKAPEVSKPHCFKLTKGGARTYYMCAGSDSDMKKWMMAMMDAIKGSSGSSNPVNLLEGSVHNVSIPALSIRDPDCHGYLYKQGQVIKAWRRRYFVLKNGFLYYYSDMSNTVALGMAKLLGYTVKVGEQTGKKYYFSAVSTDPSSRTYFFAADSDMDRNRWLSRLEDSIKKGATVY